MKMNRWIKPITFIFFLYFLAACRSKKENYEFFNRYVFLAHTYDKSNVLDARIPVLSNTFSQIWLGGDILDLGKDTNGIFTLDYLDKILNIKSSSTQWSLGNHEKRFGLSKIAKYTQKPGYYAKYIKGITLININSNLLEYSAGCAERNQQVNFVLQVLDTIQKSSHVILLSHHVIWEGFSEDSVLMKDYANTSHSHKFMYCSPNLTPHEVLAPKIDTLIKRKKKIIFLSGDFGQKNSTYAFQNKNGLTFLGNGILARNKYNKKFNRLKEEDSVLVFYHFYHSGILKWQFVPLSDL
ncbi:hypothetical protein DNU06_10840 [Putridiphycobacter roseus]|uniref:Calcineurin-like phosphoesterase domain-containing protein n=1 Tax=Putridiphycobacter roseus TaxID=2219161 RepID=A0A2W1NQ38_9FLAO|nr:hypothetical protein [Putridiphycobacter roseus]PZE16748.1 hypothetical protein DNU06_10840 [Putridiphycobacter roseus]